MEVDHSHLPKWVETGGEAGGKPSSATAPLPSEPGSSPSEALLGCGDSYDKEANIVEASDTGLLSSMMEKRSSHGCKVGFFTNTKAFLWPGALEIIFGLCRV